MDFLRDFGSQHLVLYGAAALLLTVYILQKANTALRGPASHVPGPWYTNWTDFVLKYHWLRGERAAWVDALHKRYGPIVRLRPSEVDVADPTAVKEIHRISTPFRKTDYYTRLTGQKIPALFVPALLL